MYLARDHVATGDYPRDCSLPEADWHILAGFWHPVAFSSDVTDKPIARCLLDVELVVYRTTAGVAVAKDVCVHRGAKVSRGWLDEQQHNVVCPFHGLHYDVTGKCTRIPALVDQSQPIPNRMRLTSYQAVERYGLIWACMKPEAIHPLPEWPFLENHGPEWLRVDIPQGFWRASASRHCENFNDIAHISWVHMKTFGNRERPQIPDYKLERTEFGLRMELPYVEVERGFNDDSLGEREVYYVHELTYPFATDLRVDYTDSMSSHFYDMGSPLSATETAIFQISLTNTPGATVKDYADYQLVTNSEDIGVVESQRPEEVPLNAAEEIHIPADKFSVQYRRDLVEKFGLGAPSMVA